MRYLSCPRKKTCFAHTPKSGVESLILLILREQGHSDINRNIWTPSRPYKVNTIPNDYEYVSISRNPYNRLVSGYIDKFLTGNFHNLKFCEDVMKHYGRSMDDMKRITFEELVKYLMEADKSKVDPHFATQISTITKQRNPQLFKIEEKSIHDKLEDLGFENEFTNYRDEFLYGWAKEDRPEAYKMGFDEFNIFDTYRGYPLDENQQGYTDDNNNHGVMPLYHNFYNDELKEMVYEYYKEDFEYFNYEK